jgi:hypothetical protein
VEVDRLKLGATKYVVYIMATSHLKMEGKPSSASHPKQLWFKESAISTQL